MAKRIDLIIPPRTMSVGSMYLVVADLECLDTPWLGQPFLPEDLGVSSIDSFWATPYSSNTAPQGQTLAGTASVTNGSAAVTGTSTKFTTQVQGGQILTFGTDSTQAVVSTVVSDTSLTLSANYGGVTNATAAIKRLDGALGGVFSKLGVLRTNQAVNLEAVASQMTGGAFSGSNGSASPSFSPTNFLTTAAVATTITAQLSAGATTGSVAAGQGVNFAAGDVVTIDYASVTKAQLNVVSAVSTDALTFRYPLAQQTAVSPTILNTKKGIGTAVTLSGAVAAAATTIGVSSATGIGVGDVLALSGDNSTTPKTPPTELMLVRSISGTTLTIESLNTGLKQAAIAHASGDKVYKVAYPAKLRYVGGTAGVDVADGTNVGVARIYALCRE